MATNRQLSIALFGFPYGGNSGVSIEQTTVSRWRERLAMEVAREPRISDYWSLDLCDTPITMTRNRAVVLAREAKADILMMVDSDMSPDVHCQPDDNHDPKAKPFFKTAFDFLYNHYDRGPVNLMAPYGGKGDHENMFVFRWRAQCNDNPDDTLFSLEQWTREECFHAAGIHDIAAGPTGLCMIDMRCFDLLEPENTDDEAWFYYEYTDKYKHTKASTEDVTFTRDLSLKVQDLYGYEPNKCLFDCWAGHNGFRVTRKPKLMTSNDVAKKYRRAMSRTPLETGQLLDVKNLASPAPKPQTNNIDRLGLRRTAKVLASVQAKGGESALAEFGDLIGRNHTPADMQALRELCQQAKRPLEELVAVEVGSFIGESAKSIVDAVDGHCRLYCIDTWEGSPNDATGIVADELGGERVKQAFLENCAADIEFGRVWPLQVDSLSAAAAWKDGDLDLAFIDANHDFAAVKADIEAWLPKVRDGGILCGHDYGPLVNEGGKETFPDVRNAVNAIFGAAHTHHVGTSVWSVVVKHNPAVVSPPVPADAVVDMESGDGDENWDAEELLSEAHKGNGELLHSVVDAQ